MYIHRVLGSHKVAGYSRAIFKVKWPTGGPTALKPLQNTAESMVYIINQSGGDF